MFLFTLSFLKALRILRYNSFRQEILFRSIPYFQCHKHLNMLRYKLTNFDIFLLHFIAHRKSLISHYRLLTITLFQLQFVTIKE